MRKLVILFDHQVGLFKLQLVDNDTVVGVAECGYNTFDDFLVEEDELKWLKGEQDIAPHNCTGIN